MEINKWPKKEANLGEGTDTVRPVVGEVFHWWLREMGVAEQTRDAEVDLYTDNMESWTAGPPYPTS